MANFRLQKLLEMKTWREQERAAAVERARSSLARADLALDRLSAIRADNLARLQQEIGSGRSVGELLHVRGVLEQIERHIAAARADRDAAQRALNATMTAFTEASTDRRAFEKLKQRHNDIARTAVNAAERASLDEIGLRRHAVRHAGGGA